MSSFLAEQVPWAEQEDYVLSVKIGAITLLSTVVLWLLLILVLKILGLSECDAGKACKSKKLMRKDKGKLVALLKKAKEELEGKLDDLVKKLEEELKGADLFAPLPPTEDCAICFVPFSRLLSEAHYQACCGKEICMACVASIDLTCPFCREPNPTSKEEYLCQLQTRCLKNDPYALALMGAGHQIGGLGAPKDDLKALDCYIRAVEIGSSAACTKIGIIYDKGNGVAVDKERAALFQRTGALRGDIYARHLIGSYEYYDLGNHEIGIRHWMILAEAGHQDSLNKLWDIYADLKLVGREFITEKYLSFASRACHEARMEVWSEEREKHRSEECSSTLPPCSYDTYDYRY